MIAAVLLIGALPAYFQALPWRCETPSAERINDISIEQLARCTPNGQAKLPDFVQQVADAMGNAGHPPRLRKGPLGPHLYAPDGLSSVSATFVTVGERFDVWISIQKLGAPRPGLPIFPDGVNVIADHEDGSGKRVLALQMDAPSRETAGLVSSSLAVLGAKALSHVETAKDGVSGRLSWGTRIGFYHVTKSGPRTSVLTLYTEPHP
jgi:hypothetical protein